jgi:hypothetical protein
MIHEDDQTLGEQVVQPERIGLTDSVRRASRADPDAVVVADFVKRVNLNIMPRGELSCWRL